MRRSFLLPIIMLLAAVPGCRESEQATPDQTRAADNAAASGAAAGAATAAATGAPRGSVAMDISVMVGGKSYRASGNGECQHAPVASIYNNPASMWRAGYSAAEGGDIPYLALTVWRPTSGSAEQFTLSLGAESERYDISTVKGSKLVGKGAAAVRNAGSGGRLEVKGEDADGTDLVVSVSCAAFTEAIAEGG